MKKIFLLTVLLMMVFVSGCIYQFSDQELSEEMICENAGGEWRQMNDACVDLCENKGKICAQVLTYGCDCGEGMCWNGEECVEE